MTDLSARFSLPLLQPGQAQKELYHNEALALVDLAMHPVAQASGVDVPPASPAMGQCWIVGSAPNDAWTGHASAIAGWSPGGWRFVTPVEGMLVWVIADATWSRRTSSAWISGDLPVSSISVGGNQVVGARRPAITATAGGTTIDAEARAAIASILTAMRAHGLIFS